MSTSIGQSRLEAGLRARRQLRPLSSRSAEERQAAEKADAATHQKLKRLLRSKGNQKCADCQVHYSGWAALPHGVFLCIDCAQLHRGIGRHISQVKAINTGTYLWYPDEVDVMVANGNDVANHLLLARHPKGCAAALPSHGSHTDRQAFLRDKYERRRWAADIREIPVETEPLSEDEEPTDGHSFEDVAPGETREQGDATAVPPGVLKATDRPVRQVRVLPMRTRRRSPLRAQKLSAEADLISLEAPTREPQDSGTLQTGVMDISAKVRPETDDVQELPNVEEGQATREEGEYDAKVSQIMALYQQPVQRGVDGHLYFTNDTVAAPVSFFEQYGL